MDSHDVLIAEIVELKKLLADKESECIMWFNKAKDYELRMGGK